MGRDDDHGQLRESVVAADHFDQLLTVHLGHHDVGDQEVDRLVDEQLERLTAMGRLQDPGIIEARDLQTLFHDHPGNARIVDQDMRGWVRVVEPFVAGG